MTGMAASAVMRAMEHCPAAPGTLLVCGGGRKNPTMMAMLQAGVDCPVQPVEAVGLDGDMLEAQAFAYLAVRVAKGLPTSCAGTTGVRAGWADGQRRTEAKPLAKEGTRKESRVGRASGAHATR